MADEQPQPPTAPAQRAERAAAVIDDRELAIPTFSKTCTYCSHWTAGEGRYCAAFPKSGGKEIPRSIWMGTNKHIQPVAGDHGIQFAPAPEVVKTRENAALLAAYAKAHPKA